MKKNPRLEQLRKNMYTTLANMSPEEREAYDKMVMESDIVVNVAIDALNDNDWGPVCDSIHEALNKNK